MNPIANGILLATCLGSARDVVAAAADRAGQLLLIGIAMLLLAGLYCTMTRSVWMGGILALALAVGLALPWNWRLPLLGGGVLAVALVAATQWENLLSFKRDEALAADKTAESVELRPIMTVVAWHMFLDRPLWGCGYWQYKTEHRNYLSDRSTDLPLERAGTTFPTTSCCRC